MLTLTLTEKGGDPKDLSFDKDEVAIGRVRGNDIVLPKGNVSKHHCRIFLREGQLTVEDLHSTNGTYVNGRKITEVTTLAPADKVFVGDFVIRNLAVGEIEPIIGPPSVPEAGSLSTALPRRQPPPPPLRPSSGLDIFDDHASSSAKADPVPPPPPSLGDLGDLGDLAQSVDAHADINLDDDDEAISTPPPRLNVPPLKPAMPAPAAVEPPPPPPAPAEPSVSKLPEPPAALSTASTQPLSADCPAWLSRLLSGEGVSAVFITGTHSVEVERDGRRESASVSASELSSVSEQLRRMAAQGTPRPAPEASIVNTLLPDGLRISALFPPAADRLCAVVRRLATASKTLDDLLADGSLSAEMQQVLEAAVNARQNVLVTGDRLACDMLLRAMVWTVDRMARVLVLAESITPPPSAASWVRLPGNADPDMLGVATALRPDYVLVDAGAGVMGADILGKCAVGLEGALVAMVARSANEALMRVSAASPQRGLETFSIDVVVHAATMADGRLRVVEIAEPAMDSERRVRAEPILTWQPNGTGSRGSGLFSVAKSVSRLAAKLESRGAGVPESVLPR